MSNNRESEKNTMYAFLLAGRDSLKVFLPKNLKLLVLVTVNAFVKTAKTVVIQCWPLFVLAFGMQTIGVFYLEPLYGQIPFWVFFMFGVLQVLIHFLFFFANIVAMRPSIEKKDFYYFYEKIKRYSIQTILFVFGFLVVTNSIMSINILFPLRYLCYLMFIFPVEGLELYAPLLVLTLFVFMDTSFGIFKSLARSFKIVLFNYPFLFITAVSVFCFYSFFSVIQEAIFWFFSESSMIQMAFVAVLRGIFSVTGHLLYFSWLHTFYLKKMHDDFDYYLR